MDGDAAVPRRGRKPDPIYGRLLELFLEGGSEKVEIDYAAMGRKPDTVQHGLNGAIKRLDLGDAVRVSLLEGGARVLLRRRMAGKSTSKSETVLLAAAIQSAGGSGVEGLVFEKDFISISEDEWHRRFPLVTNPDGDEEWDYGNNAVEALLDQQDPLCIWTHHHDSGDGTGDYFANGRWRVNRLGYYVSTLPVPAHLRIQVWDDPWPAEDIEFLNSAVHQWQQQAGVPSDTLIEDEFAEWWWQNHSREDQIERHGYENRLTDIGIAEVFDDWDHYRSVREMPAKGKPEPELAPFVVDIRSFLESGHRFVRLPESPLEPRDLAALVNRAIGRLGVNDQVWTKVSRGWVWLSSERVRAGYTSLDFDAAESERERSQVVDVEVRDYDDELWFTQAEAVIEEFLESGDEAWRIKPNFNAVGLGTHLGSVLAKTDYGFRASVGGDRFRRPTLSRKSAREEQQERSAALSRGWVPDRSEVERQLARREERLAAEQREREQRSSLPDLPTWVEAIVQLNHELNAVSFVDELSGWIVGDQGRIWHTADGGLTWDQQLAGGDYTLYRVAFIDAITGWATGQRVAKPGVVLSTTDGGLTWSEVPLPTPSSTGPDDVFALSPSLVVISADGQVHHSGNGGLTWQTAEPRDYGGGNLHFANENRGWFCGEAPPILATTDGGQTWEEQSVRDGEYEVEYLQDIHFFDAEHGSAVGWHGVVATTADGGATWTSQRVGPEENLLAVFQTSELECWAAGGYEKDLGLLLRTTDSGGSWNIYKVPSGECLNDVFFINSSLGWAVGEGGIVLRIRPPA